MRTAMRAGRRPRRKNQRLTLAAEGRHVEGIPAPIGHFHPRRIVRDAGTASPFIALVVREGAAARDSAAFGRAGLAPGRAMITS